MSKLADFEKSIHREMIDVWHHLHENPELSFKEYKTADYIEKTLCEKTSIDRIERVGETGLWVELAGAAPVHPGEKDVIALRADIDALPVEEKTGLPFCSKISGVMHACGHDMHTSCLIASIRILEHYRDRIPGTLWFFFQPAEELSSGARTFTLNPAIDFSRIKAVAGLHMYGGYDGGKVILKEGALMAGIYNLIFTVKGEGGHAAMPHKTRDPITAAATLILELQTLISRETDPLDSAVLSLCLIQGGTKENIIASEVRIEGTLRFLSVETRDRLREGMFRICRGVGESMRVTIDMDITNELPPVLSSAPWVKAAEKGAAKALGAENVFRAEKPVMGGEDFSLFLEKAPGVFMFIGCKSPDKEGGIWHSCSFYTDEAALRAGALAYSSFALESFGVEQ
jgi:amidohydrolase